MSSNHRRRLSFFVVALASLSLSLAGCLFPGLEGERSISQRVIASEGGYVCFGEAAHIAIPRGALPHDTAITIAPVPEAPESLAHRRLLLPGYDFGPDGTRFATPARITLHADPPEGVTFDQLGMLAQSSDGTIEELTGVSADPISRTVSAPVAHFTTYYVYIKGPAGGRGIQVGGPGLVPLFGATVAGSGSAPYVSIWLGPDGKVRNDAYSSASADALVIQIDTLVPTAGQPVHVEAWVVDPVDPGHGATNVLGERISTYGFWHDYLLGLTSPLRTQGTDADGALTIALDGLDLQRHVAMAPPGYASGRLHLRAFGNDPADAADIYLSFALNPATPR